MKNKKTSKYLDFLDYCGVRDQKSSKFLSKNWKRVIIFAALFILFINFIPSFDKVIAKVQLIIDQNRMKATELKVAALLKENQNQGSKSLKEIEKNALEAILANADLPVLPFKTNEILVKFKSGSTLTLPEDQKEATLEQVDISSEAVLEKSSQYNVETIKEVALPGAAAGTTYTITYNSATDPLVVAEEFKKLAEVEIAEPNYLYYVNDFPRDPPNDPLYNEQWHHQNLQSRGGWVVETGDEDVVIAVLDSGIDANHPDFRGKLVDSYDVVDIDEEEWRGYAEYGVGLIEGEDYTEPDNEPVDRHGHGTHVAGIIAAATNNEVGISGVCPDCKIMPVRIGFLLSYRGHTTASMENDDIIAGIEYAMAHGADVINMSFGGPGNSIILRDALDAAYEQGVVLVAAAGNENTFSMSYPAAYENVIAVSAIGQDNHKAEFSNYGEWVDIAAPGVQILSAKAAEGAMCDQQVVAEHYCLASGTSMASPVVAGVAGLVKSQHLDWSPYQVRRQLVGSSQPLDDQVYIGAGRVNSFRALTARATPRITLVESSFQEIQGNNDNIINRGETIGLTVTLKNIWADAHGVNGTLITEDQGVNIRQAPRTYGDILENQEVANNEPFIFEVSQNYQGNKLNFTLRLTNREGVGNSVRFSLPVPRAFIVDASGNGDYTDLNEAAVNLNDGDMIIIRPGQYTFTQSFFTKNYLTLRGEDKEQTIIDCEGREMIPGIFNQETNVYFPKHYFKVQNLTLKNCQLIFPDSHHVTIENNIFDITKLLTAVIGNTYYGKNDYLTVSNNIIRASAPLGSAIYSNTGSREVTIENNKITAPYGASMAIVMFEPAAGAPHRVVNNDILLNKYFNPGAFEKIQDHNTGIAVVADQDVDLLIAGNKVAYADTPLVLIGSVRNAIETHIKIYHNDFLQARRAGIIGGLSVLFSNDGQGNYWSGYQGNDENGDAIGEQSYLIDRQTRVYDQHPFIYEKAWQEEQQTVSLRKNTPSLISFYILPADKSLANVLPQAARESLKYILSEYLPENQRLNNNEQFTPGYLEFGKGYLVETSRDVTFSVSGKRLTTRVTVNLAVPADQLDNDNQEEHFNLIGYPLHLVQPIGNIFPRPPVGQESDIISVADLAGPEYQLNGELSSRNVLNTLEPGKGYLVRSRGNHSITYYPNSLRITCSSNLDCLPRSLNQYSCSEQDYYKVYANLAKYICVRPGELNSYCQRQGRELTEVGACESILVNNNDVPAICYQGGCISRPVCLNTEGCPDRQTDPYCANGDVYQRDIIKQCLNARTPQASCQYQESEPRLAEDCRTACNNGQCVEVQGNLAPHDWSLRELINANSHFDFKLADLDNDDDLDLLIAFTNKIYVFRNTGNANSPRWQRVENDFGLGTLRRPGVFALFVQGFAVADLDNDNDPDLLMRGYDQLNVRIHYLLYRNNGNAQNPQFSAEAISLPDEIRNAGGISSITLTDLDHDNDFDLVLGSQRNYFQYSLKNIGSPEEMRWQVNNWQMAGLPEAMEMNEEGLYPASSFADLDNDGDYDIIIGLQNGTTHLIRNTGNREEPAWREENFADWDLSLFQVENGNARPALADLDNDGDADAVSADYNQLKGFINIAD